MSAVFRRGFERGKISKNTCQGVKIFRETARTRYVTGAEYNLLHSVSPDYVKVDMEISYLSATRKADVLEIKKGQLQKEPI